MAKKRKRERDESGKEDEGKHLKNEYKTNQKKKKCEPEKSDVKPDVKPITTCYTKEKVGAETKNVLKTSISSRRQRRRERSRENSKHETKKSKPSRKDSARLKIDAEVEDEKKADLKYGRSRGRSKKRIPKLGSPKSPNKRTEKRKTSPCAKSRKSASPKRALAALEVLGHIPDFPTEKSDAPALQYVDKLPAWRHNWYGEVVFVDDSSNCGLLRLSPIDGFKVYCMFPAANIWPRLTADKRFSSTVLVGHIFKVNIKLVDCSSKIPYVATNVWPGQVDVPPNIQSKPEYPISGSLRCAYEMFSPCLSEQILDAGQECAACTVFCPYPTCGLVIDTVYMFWQHIVDSHLRIEVLQEVTARYIGGDKYHCPFKFCPFIFNFSMLKEVAQSGLVLDHLKVEHFDMFSVKLETSFPIFCLENRGFINSFRVPLQQPPEKPLESLDETAEKKTIELDLNMNGINAGLVEVLAARQGVVKHYFDERSGILEVGSDRTPVLFNIQHVLMIHSVIGLHLFEELYCQKSLLKLVPTGSKVICRARAVETPGIRFQATSVILGGCDLEYQVQMNLPHLDLEIEKYLFQFFKVPPTKESLICHPLKHPDFIQDPLQGVVQEHISATSGLIKVFSEDSVVLFDLRQLRIKNLNNNNSSVELSSGTVDVLRSLLPIGSAVTMYVRKVPAHGFSELRYQAVSLVKGIFNSSPPLESCILLELGSAENVYGMISNLDQNYEVFKFSARLHLVKSSEISPVPVVLDCLPVGWEAIIISSLNEEIGVIKICKESGENISVPGQLVTVKHLYAIFHISDVTISQNFKKVMKCNMSTIMGSRVDLRARNVTMCERPSEVLVETEKFFNQEKTDLVRTLQAIQVFVKNTREERIPKDVPRPTILRAAPGSFNSTSRSAFFCNESLRHNLNSKIADYLKSEEGTTPMAYPIKCFYENILMNPIAGTVRYATGRVMRILSDNYGVGTMYLEKDGKQKGHVEVLFDIYDVWVGSTVCASAGIKLGELIKPGDYIKFLCVPVHRHDVPSVEWNVQFLATSVVTALSSEDLSEVVLPGSEVYNVEDICKDKLENFLTVVEHIEKIEMSQEEKTILQEVEWFLKPKKTDTLAERDETEDLIVGKTGSIVMLLDDEFGIIRFQKEDSNNSEKISHALFQRQSVYRNIDHTMSTNMSEGKMRLFLKPGYPVRFNAFRVKNNVAKDSGLVDFYASSVNFGNLISRKLHDTDLYYEQCEIRNNTGPVEDSCKGFVKSGFNALKSFFTSDFIGIDCHRSLSVDFQSEMQNCESNVIYKGSDFLVVQFDFGKVTVYGMYLESKLHENCGMARVNVSFFVNVDAQLVNPCGGVQYLVTRLYQVDSVDSSGAGHKQLSDENQTVLLERFHTNMTKVYHLPQIFHATAIESLLRPLFPRQAARTIILEYYAQLIAGPVYVDHLVSMADESLTVTPETIKLFLLHLGYISLTSPSPRFNGIILTPEVTARLRSAILPVNCILNMGGVQPASNVKMGGPIEGWSGEKDLVLLRGAMAHFFSWKSLLADESFVLRDEVADPWRRDRPLAQVLVRFLHFVDRFLLAPNLQLRNKD